MSAEVFIETNVFIYQLDATDARKHEAAERIVRDGLASGNACISFQVVQECLKFGAPRDEVIARNPAVESVVSGRQLQVEPVGVRRKIDAPGTLVYGELDRRQRDDRPGELAASQVAGRTDKQAAFTLPFGS